MRVPGSTPGCDVWRIFSISAKASLPEFFCCFPQPKEPFRRTVVDHFLTSYKLFIAIAKRSSGKFCDKQFVRKLKSFTSSEGETNNPIDDFSLVRWCSGPVLGSGSNGDNDDGQSLHFVSRYWPRS